MGGKEGVCVYVRRRYIGTICSSPPHTTKSICTAEGKRGIRLHKIAHRTNLDEIGASVHKSSSKALPADLTEIVLESTALESLSCLYIPSQGSVGNLQVMEGKSLWLWQAGLVLFKWLGSGYGSDTEVALVRQGLFEVLRRLKA